MRIAVLHSSPRPTWTSRRLLDAIESRGAMPLYLLWNYLAAELGSESCPIKYRGRCLDVDAIIVRSLGRGLSLEKFTARKAILEAAQNYGYVVVNPSPGIFLARDKFTSLRLLRKAGLPVPKTVITEDPAYALSVIEQLGEVVFKPIIGSLGLGSFKVNSIDAGYHIVNLLLEMNQPIYMQEYIEKKGGRDLRVFVVDSRPVASMYRVSSGTWKTNIARGAKPLPATPPEEILEAAVKAAETLGLVYAGVDIAEKDEGGFVIFEVNASPLWRGLYTATGVDPAYHIVDAVIRLAKR